METSERQAQPGIKVARLKDTRSGTDKQGEGVALPKSMRQVLPATQKKVFIVVPAFNEALNIRDVLDEVLSLRLPRLDVDHVVVDDGSRDETRFVAKRAGAKVVSLPFNLGIGLSVQTGFAYALAHGADYVVQVDGDGQHIPSEIAKLLEPVLADQADVVVGTRFAKKGGPALTSTTFLRWLAGRVLSWTIRFLTGERITDTTSGFRIFNRRAAEFIAHDYPDDYPEVEVLVNLVRHGFRITEVPVQMRSRKFGRSSISWSRSIYYVLKVVFASFMGKVRR